MLSLSKISSASGCDYYLELAREDYYLEGGEPPGQWHGQGAARLGLAGMVAGEELTRLLAAIVPANGDPTLVLPGFVADGARDLGFRVEQYDSLERGAGDLLAAALGTAGLDGERIGLELGGLEVPGRSRAEAEALLGGLRAALRRVAEILRKAAEDIDQVFKAGPA